MHFSSYLASLIDIMPEIKLIPVRKLTNSFVSVVFSFRLHFEHDAFSSVFEKIFFQEEIGLQNDETLDT